MALRSYIYITARKDKVCIKKRTTKVVNEKYKMRVFKLIRQCKNKRH